MTTDELIETLERLEKGSTPGPWKHKKSIHGNKYRYVEIGDDGTYTTLELEPGDARLIAALRNHLPALISALKENKRLREALEPFAAACAKADQHADEVKRAGMGTVSDNATPGWGVRYGHLKAARAALQPQGDAKP